MSEAAPDGRPKEENVGTTLYETDFIGWAEQQAGLLRAAAAAARPELPLDWEHLAEEVENLGRSYRRALANHVGTAIEHLLWLEIAPDSELRPEWLDSLARARGEIAGWLADEPGLRDRLAGIVAEQLPLTAQRLAELLRAEGEPVEGVATRLASGGYSAEQVAGDWLPPAP